MSRGKDVTVTFKVDEILMEAMKDIPNRSEFIRSAVLSALDNTCPLCSGMGTLTPNQKRHWEAFSESHSMKKCRSCNEHFVICDKSDAATERANPHSKGKRKKAGGAGK